MIDALLPAVEALHAAEGEGASLGDALRRSADAAQQGMEATTPLVARKGRASYLGERSAGHQDPARRRRTCSWSPPRSGSPNRAAPIDVNVSRGGHSRQSSSSSTQSTVRATAFRHLR